MARGAATATQQAQEHQEEEEQVVLPPLDAAIDDDDEDIDDNKQSLVSFRGPSTACMRTYGRSHRRYLPLNAVDDTDTFSDDLYDSIPVASSSRVKL